MLAEMAPGSGREMAVIGTVSANLDDLDVSPRTTPESSDLQRIFRKLLDRGRITDIAMEVSSHAMALGRVNGTEFDVVAFTNLSQDHLDYHHTMEEYFAAKAKLFARRWAPQAVIWTDDPWGKRLAEETALPVISVGGAESCDVTVRYGRELPERTEFQLDIAGVTKDVAIALAGRFNVANAAIALTCARLQGWDLDRSIARLGAMAPVPGRYNTIPNERGVWVVVDYAHTPDAISGVITETRDLIKAGDRTRRRRGRSRSGETAADGTGAHRRGYRHRHHRQPAVGEPRRHSRAGSLGYPGGHRGHRRARPAGRYPVCSGASASRRRRADPGQGPRDRSGVRRSHRAV